MTPQLARNAIDPTTYWEDGNFLAYSFATELVDVYNIATTVQNDRIYWHNGRVWHEFGEMTLRGEIRALLGDAANREIVNEVVRNTKHLTRTRREELFDFPDHKVVVKNGVIDLVTGEFSPNWKTPGTQTWLDVRYDEEAVPTNFNDFLFDVLHPDDVSVMWELIGYCLYSGYPFQKAALFLGEGANGKSTLLNALSAFLGKENISSVELQTLSRNRFATADLEGKLANIAADLSNKDMKYTGTFKELTGGDTIRAERKRKPSFQFENTATLIFSANEPPTAEDETHAYRRRWLYFEFPNTFGSSGDKQAVSQSDLLAQFEDEHSGILNMAMQHFQDLWERGGFEETVYQSQHEDAHDRATNPAHTFASDMIEASEGGVLRRKDALQAFNQWCEETGQTKQGKQALEGAVRSVHAPDEGKDPNDGRYAAWFDVQLVDADDQESATDESSPTGLSDY